MNCAVSGGGGANILPEPGVASVTVMVYPETATVPEAEWLKVPAVPVNEIALVPGGVRLSCEVMILNGTVLPVAVTVGEPNEAPELLGSPVGRASTTVEVSKPPIEVSVTV